MTIKIFTVAEMVAAERAADAAGLPYAQMMENAGRAVAEAILARTDVAGRGVLVLVGPGNNGGDGLVAGRYLAEAGATVAFYLSKPREAAADEHLARVEAMGLEVLLAGYDQRYRVLRHRLRITHILVDALLGTGVSKPVTGTLADLMGQVKAGLDETNTAAPHEPALLSLPAVEASFAQPATPRPYVVAVDCPSGMNSDTGALDAQTLKADLTVTFAGPKRGHFRFPGAAACGELVIADIGISPTLPEVAAVPLDLATPALVRAWLPPRPPDGHKGTFGTAFIVAGSDRYWGAPGLAARGAFRVGAGLVALGVPPHLRPVLAGQLPEATYPPLPDRGVLAEASARIVRESAAGTSALLVGPGLGEAGAFMETLFPRPATGAGSGAAHLPPLVIDADGLNLLAGMGDWSRRLPDGSILTPHPGEMARLMGMKLSEVREADRVELARSKAAAWGHIVVLKGAYTVVAAPDGRSTLLPFANPLLAVGGSGDVLAGAIVGLLAQGVAPYEAAVLGGYLHAAAGQAAAGQFGDVGLLASELADWLPVARARLLEAGGNAGIA